MNILLQSAATIINKAFFNTMNCMVGICPMHALGPFLCPTTEEKKACCPKVRALGPVLSKRV